ncbi:YddF family protein [Candidatus Darwinibacter acetoxidans]|jgi:hypothetical protein|nr:YddF family protein [Bacillota bacterium]
MSARHLEYEDEVLELLALDGGMLPVVLLNGPICTTTGLYRISELEVEDAKRLVNTYGWVSAVGHEASAQVLSHVLGIDVPMNRIQYEQQVGQKAIALKLNLRPPEGQVLSVEEMLEIGFSLWLLQRLE